MKDIKGKFIVAFDTICDGWECAKDEDGKPDPELFDSEADAFHEIFADALSGLKGTDDGYFEENDLDKDKVISEMEALLEEGDFEKMSNYFDVNPTCNYYEEFIVPAEEFILGRKTIFTGQGIVIEGTKIEDL
jgi:hypothetical protein